VTGWDLGLTTGVTHTLTPPRVFYLLRAILGWKNVRSDDLIRPGEALVLWVADLLARDEPISADQITYLLHEFHGGISDFGRRLWKILEEYESKGSTTADMLSGHLSIYDYHYARLAGSETILDLQKAVQIPAIPQAPLKVVAYDLTTLFTSYRAKMVKRMNTPTPV
jgi:hypothetical protein